MSELSIKRYYCSLALLNGNCFREFEHILKVLDFKVEKDEISELFLVN